MYKLQLCLRYLRTRWIAMASIVSVMLGVATMIVVNSVMAGFATEMRERIHGILADIVVETHTLDGDPDAAARMQEIQEVAGNYVEAMTATVFSIRLPWALTRQESPLMVPTIWEGTSGNGWWIGTAKTTTR